MIEIEADTEEQEELFLTAVRAGMFNLRWEEDVAVLTLTEYGERFWLDALTDELDPGADVVPIKPLVHNHPPYHPSCSEYYDMDGNLRGRCLDQPEKEPPF